MDLEGAFSDSEGVLLHSLPKCGGHGVLVAKKALENSRLTGTEFIGLSSTRVLINRFLIKNVYLVVNFGSQRRTNIKPALRGPPGGLARPCPYQIISAKVTYVLNRHCDIISVLHLQAKFPYHCYSKHIMNLSLTASLGWKNLLLVPYLQKKDSLS